MDPITRKLVETVNIILNEAAARGGAAIFADMSDSQFENWISSNPGAAEKARALRVQGQATRGQPTQTQPTPTQYTRPQPARQQKTESTYTPYTVSAPEHESEKPFTQMVDEWTKAKNTNPEVITDYMIGVLQHRAAKTKDAALHEKLLNHPETDMRYWALQNPLTTSDHINKLVQDKDAGIRHAALGLKAFSAENMKTLFDNSLSQINIPKNKDDHHDHYMLIQSAMHQHPQLYTSDMHETLLNHKDSNLRSLAERWVKSGRQPHGNDGY